MSMRSSSVSSGDDYGGGGGKKQQPQPVLINIETMRLQMSSMAARIMSRVSVDTLRPLPTFLGLDKGVGFCLSPQAFTPPVKKVDKSAPEKVKNRVLLNFNFFLSNYVLLAGLTGLVIALMHPGMVFFLAIVYGLWTLHGFLIRHQLVLFGIPVHALLTVQQRFYILFTITSIVVIWKCLAPTLIFLSITTLIILTHALLRDPKDVEAKNGLFDEDADDVEAAGGESLSDGSGSSEVLVERPERSGGRKKANNKE
jgi:PRA1 family protein